MPPPAELDPVTAAGLGEAMVLILASNTVLLSSRVGKCHQLWRCLFVFSSTGMIDAAANEGAGSP